MFKRLFIGLLTPGILCPGAALAQPQQQTTVYVDAESSNTAPPSDGNPGSSWSDQGTSAYAYLQNGLSRADQLLFDDPETPIQIWVREGIYRADLGAGITPGDRAATIRLRENVRICGGFAGDEPETDIGFRSRNPMTNVTVITGDLDDDDDLGNPATWTDNTFHILTAESVLASAIIDGFTVTSGNANNSVLPIEERVGGGMVILGGTDFEPQLPVNACLPTILRCRFEVNRARNGGAVFLAINQQNQPVFQNCVFLANRADGDAFARRWCTHHQLHHLGQHRPGADW